MSVDIRCIVARLFFALVLYDLGEKEMLMDSLAHASIDRLTLESMTLKNCTVPALHRYSMQPAEEERFVYITQGEVSFFLEEGELSAKARDMIYLPRNTAYLSQWHSQADFVVVDLLLRDNEGQDIVFGDRPCVLFRDIHCIYDDLLMSLAEKADSTGPFDWLERISLCFKFLCQMARDTNREELDENSRRIKEGLDFLEANYTQDFSMEELASVCCLSPAVFRRNFFACKGMSPVDYRNRLRIRKATELLRSGQYTISEVAEKVGIGDIKYFGKLFKRYAGVNPGMIKRNNFQGT